MGFSKKDIKRAQVRNALRYSKEDDIEIKRPKQDSLGKALEKKNKKLKKMFEVYR